VTFLHYWVSLYKWRDYTRRESVLLSAGGGWDIAGTCWIEDQEIPDKQKFLFCQVSSEWMQQLNSFRSSLVAILG
jgi:hypothetical protein